MPKKPTDPTKKSAKIITPKTSDTSSVESKPRNKNKHTSLKTKLVQDKVSTNTSPSAPLAAASEINNTDSHHNPITDTKPKQSALNQKSILVGISVLGIFLVICIVIIGFVGYSYYKEYTASHSITAQINTLNDGFKPIENDYESLVNDLNGFDSKKYPKDQADKIISEVSDVNTKLDVFRSQLTNSKNSDLQAYVDSLIQFTDGIKNVNTNVVALIGYASCYSAFDNTTANLGKKFSAVDQSDTNEVANLYDKLSGATQDLETCFGNLNQDGLGELSDIVRSLNDKTTIVSSGINDNTLTQAQLDEFISVSVSLQSKALSYAESITASMEQQISTLDTTLVDVKAEQQKLSDKYNITFE